MTVILFDSLGQVVTTVQADFIDDAIVEAENAGYDVLDLYEPAGLVVEA